MIGFLYLKERQWYTNDGVHGSVFPPGAAGPPAHDAGSQSPVCGDGPGLCGQRIPVQCGQPDACAPASGHGADLLDNRLAGAGDLPGGYGWLPNLLGIGGKPGDCMVRGRRLAGTAAGQTGGEQGPATDDPCHRRLSHSGDGTDLPDRLEGGSAGASFPAADGDGPIDQHVVHPGGGVPGRRHRLVGNWRGDIGPGSGNIGTLSGTWVHCRRDSGGQWGLSGGGTGWTGIGLGSDPRFQ